MTTATLSDSNEVEFNKGQPGTMGDLARLMRKGTMDTPRKVVVAALTATATPDITSAAVLAAATITPALPSTVTRLPAIKTIRTLRVTASGTAASLGAYIVTDSGGTAIIPPGGASLAVGVALLSDDGKTITFPNTVTGFVVEYDPRPAVDMNAVFAPST